MLNLNDGATICAVSTPHGVGGIAVVRVSGTQAFEIVGKLWKGKPVTTMQSHTAHHGLLADLAGEMLDDVVLTIFRAPRSFTGEDVAEISCHGSLWLQQSVMHALIDAGCTAALPGEFTRRAFANGKLDLAQAEAVADVIAATSRAAHRVAMHQMKGTLTNQLKMIRQKLVRLSALFELELDFSEEDVTFADRNELVALAEEIEHTLKHTAQSFHDGDAIKRGVPVAIVGNTNAGKSTLLNLLLGDDRALVSDMRGTTRDTIEDTAVVEGIQFRFIDTAGLREHTDNNVEKMGIERTFATIGKARIVMWVIDPNETPDETNAAALEIAERIDGQTRLLVVINKSDTIDASKLQNTNGKILATQTQLTLNAPTAIISAREKTGIKELKNQLAKLADVPDTSDANAVIITNTRHYQALTEAANAIRRAADALKQGLSTDLAAQDIRQCLYHIGEITGEISNELILNEIFKSFCVGK